MHPHLREGCPAGSQVEVGGGPVQHCSTDTQMLGTLELFCVLNMVAFPTPSPCLFLFWLKPVPSVNYTAEARFSII